MNEYVTPVTSEALAPTLHWVQARIEEANLPSQKSFHFQLGAEEAIVNIFAHAAASELTLTFLDAKTLEVKDDASPFNPLDVEVRIDAKQPLIEREQGGLGIHFLKESIDSIDYRREGPHNILTLRMQDD